MTMPPPSEWPTKVALSCPSVDHQVAHAAGVGAERVVPARLGRLAVPDEIRRDHGEAGGEIGHHPLPGRGVGGDAVHEHDRRAAPGGSVGHAVAVEHDLLELEVLRREPSGRGAVPFAALVGIAESLLTGPVASGGRATRWRVLTRAGRPPRSGRGRLVLPHTARNPSGAAALRRLRAPAPPPRRR